MAAQSHVPRFGARRGSEFRREISGQVVAHTDDELPLAFLRHAEFPGVLDLAVDAIAGVSLLPAQLAGFLLQGSEVLATRRVAESKDVFHHEHARLKEVQVTKEFAVEVAPRILHKPARAVVGAVAHAGPGESLAGRPADDDVDRGLGAGG